MCEFVSKNGKRSWFETFSTDSSGDFGNLLFGTCTDPGAGGKGALVSRSDSVEDGECCSDRDSRVRSCSFTVNGGFSALSICNNETCPMNLLNAAVLTDIICLQHTNLGVVVSLPNSKF